MNGGSDSRSRECLRQCEDGFQTRVDDIDDLGTAMADKPSNRRKDLPFEVPVQKTSHICKPGARQVKLAPEWRARTTVSRKPNQGTG